MSRLSLLLVAFACLTFAGCGGPGSIEAPDETEPKEKTPIEADLEAAGMGNMSDADYYKGGK